MSDLLIRDARPEDRPTIIKLTIAAYEQYAPIMQDMWTYYRENMVSTLSEADISQLIVAEQGGTIIASVLLLPQGTVVELPDGSSRTMEAPEVRLLAVLPSALRQGIGRAMVE